MLWYLEYPWISLNYIATSARAKQWLLCATLLKDAPWYASEPNASPHAPREDSIRLLPWDHRGYRGDSLQPRDCCCGACQSFRLCHGESHKESNGGYGDNNWTYITCHQRYAIWVCFVPVLWQIEWRKSWPNHQMEQGFCAISPGRGWLKTAGTSHGDLVC